MSSTARLVLVGLFLGAFLALLTSCGSNSTPSPAPAPSPVPPGTHLYMAVSGNEAGEILQFDLPFTNTSTPTVAVSTPFARTLAVDANGNIAAGDGFGHIAVFNAPLSDSSAPAVVFNNSFGTGTVFGNPGLVFDTAGELFATGITPDFSTSVINRFTPPLASDSIPSQVITDSSLQETSAAVLDADGNLIVNNVGFTSSPSSLAVFEPPYTGAPLATPLQTTDYAGLAVIGNQLFVCNFGQQQVDVYNLPLTADSTPAFSITNGLNSPSSVAFDSSGNLYVGHVINLIESVRLFINMYSPPFSASSVPSVMMPGPGLGGVPFVTFGLTVAVGK